MFDFHEKRKIWKILYSKTVLILLILLAIFLSNSVYNRFVVTQETKVKLEERKASLESLEERADILDEKVRHLENERGIEEELRNRFDVAKEGEQVIIILDDKNAQDKNDEFETSKTNIKEKTGISLFLNFLKFW